MKKLSKFVGAELICFVVAGIGSIVTFSQIPTWYATLIKPAWNPPNWLFGPVWTILYTLMGISLYLLWQSKSKTKTVAVQLFYIQLILNILWSWIFFGWHLLGFALIEIIILWIAIIKIIFYSYKVSKTAGIILIPYLLWVSFASFLNYTIWMLNK